MRTLPLNRRYSRRRFSHGEEERPDGSNYGADAVIMLYATSFTYSFICGERRNAVQVFGLERPERRESGTRTRKA